MKADWTHSAGKVLGSAIAQLTPVGGGDFAQSYRAQLNSGDVLFVKTHSNPPENFFSTEAVGLKWLRDTRTVSVPEVKACSDDPPFLALQWINMAGSEQSTIELVAIEQSTIEQADAEFGRSLARLHRVPCIDYGRSDDRTTGSLGLPNQPCDSWSEFYGTCRLLPLAAIARQRKSLAEKDIDAVERLANRLDQLDIPVEPPSLLHGDLWAGNRVIDSKGVSWVIDPAAHRSSREFDLAMMQLFGGFGPDCFAAYHAEFPLQAEWQSRVSLHQLAPLIVHAIKFGSSYVPSVRKALRAWA